MDDPRMLTVSGLRRRGYTPESIRTFCEKIGIGRSDNTVEMAMPNTRFVTPLQSTRAMAVLNPVKLVIDIIPRVKPKSSTR